MLVPLLASTAFVGATACLVVVQWLRRPRDANSARCIDLIDRIEEIGVSFDKGLVTQDQFGRLQIAMSELTSIDDFVNWTPEGCAAMDQVERLLLQIEREIPSAPRR